MTGPKYVATGTVPKGIPQNNELSRGLYENVVPGKITRHR